MSAAPGGVVPTISVPRRSFVDSVTSTVSAPPPGRETSRFHGTWPSLVTSTVALPERRRTALGRGVVPRSRPRTSTRAPETLAVIVTDETRPRSSTISAESFGTRALSSAGAVASNFSRLSSAAGRSSSASCARPML